MLNPIQAVSAALPRPLTTVSPTGSAGRPAGATVGASPVLSALLILLVMVLVTVGLTPNREEFRWFLQLLRPVWLTFERWIPLIWLVIYSCFYGSALMSWMASGRWDLMAGYLLLLVLVQSYTVLICRTRRLRNGTVIGFLGWVWGIALAIAVVPVSRVSWLLLLPYLLWSPVGTYVTWRMQRINR